MEQIAIKSPDFGFFTVEIEGTTSLICNKRRLEDKIGPKKTIDEEREFMNCLYKIEGEKNKFGFPASGFKKCFEEAAKGKNWFADPQISGKRIKGGLFILTDLVPIQGTPTPRKDYVVIKKATVLKIRAEFKKWSCSLPIKFVRNLLTPNQLLNVINIAGTAVGVGDWRPQRNGTHGTFKITKVIKMKI